MRIPRGRCLLRVAAAMGKPGRPGFRTAGFDAAEFDLLGFEPVRFARARFAWAEAEPAAAELAESAVAQLDSPRVDWAARDGAMPETGQPLLRCEGALVWSRLGLRRRVGLLADRSLAPGWG